MCFEVFAQLRFCQESRKCAVWKFSILILSYVDFCFNFCYFGFFNSHRDEMPKKKQRSDQNWLIIEKIDLTQGDDYSVWLEARSATGVAKSKMLNFSLDDIG